MSTKMLFKVIKGMNFKNMLKIVKKISKKTNRNFLIIFFDVVWCGFKYQASYYDYMQFEFYNLKHKERKTFITRGVNNFIIKKYNKKDEWYLFKDKFCFYKKFEKYLKRSYITLNNNFDEFEKFIKKHKKVIAKPPDGECGRDILKIEFENKLDLKKVYNDLIENNQLIVEEYIVQHSKLDELYSGSVNSIRMFTFFNNGQSYFLTASLKIGRESYIDNFSGGGMYTFLNEYGEIVYPAIDKNDDSYFVHPVSNKKLIGFKVPYFKEAIELVKEAAKVVPNIQYVGWDVAITNKGPLIIEGNCYPAIFQLKPSLSKDKTGLIPKYKKYMDI